MGQPLTSKKIALVCRRVTGVSGTTTTLLEHAKRLVALGCQVEVVGQILDHDRIRATGARPRTLWSIPWGSWRKRAFFAWRFDRRAQRPSYDLIHGHGDTFTQDVLSLHNSVHAAHEAIHGAPLPEDNAVGKLHQRQLANHRYKKIIANSKQMSVDLQKRFGVSESSIDVIYPGHDSQRFSPAQRTDKIRSAWKIPEDAFLIGLITSGDFKKRGVAPFIGCLQQLSPDQRQRLFLLVLGKEKDFSPYQKQAAEVGVAARFSQPVQNVEDFYRALDLYVHPALYEEFGQSVQEAMACGTPVLVGPNVGAGELIPSSGSFGKVQRNAPQEFADRLRQILGLSKEERRTWGRSLIPGVAWNTWDENFRRTWDVYNQLSGETSKRLY